MWFKNRVNIFRLDVDIEICFEIDVSVKIDIYRLVLISKIVLIFRGLDSYSFPHLTTKMPKTTLEPIS